MSENSSARVSFQIGDRAVFHSRSDWTSRSGGICTIARVDDDGWLLIQFADGMQIGADARELRPLAASPETQTDG
ncbi:MAG TPA: hypothetical protein VGQ44_17110 [Gemmatimonadaceae bacterium]|jgi:hypothetical protein|nr:hypothetical protein [Gemmatimonadaceae bacterium]